MDRELAQIGAGLRAAGLTRRALAAWCGTERIAAVPARLGAIRGQPVTRGGAILALWVGGAEVARSVLGGAAHQERWIDAMVAHGVLERSAGSLRARVAIVPIGDALLVCDRRDAPSERERVCWPDDSSHHLAAAIPPGRRGDWLDLGCGSGFAALARPELASRIVGVELAERAVRYARLGAALSGIPHLAIAHRDLGDAHEPADLVTCNAPIPDLAAEGAPAGGRVVWRRAEPGLFERLWPAALGAVRPGGMIVVHGASDAVVPALARASGERVIVRYTPASSRGFAVAWWRPDAAGRWVETHRALTQERPHLTSQDREEAL